MLKSKQKKVLSALLLAALMTTSSFAAFADEAVPISASDLITVPVTVTPENQKIGDVFYDVLAGSDLEKAVAKLKEAGVLHGYEDGTFRAENHLTRAEFCKMVNKLFGYTAKAAESFPDVAADIWYYNDALIAKQQGYIAGYEDGTFRGDENVSREQVCVILNRILGLYKLGDVTVSDEISDWAKDSVANVVSNGFMKLEDGNAFRAKENITRDEFARLFALFVQESKPDSGDTTGGNTGGSTSGGSTGGGSTSGGSTSGGSTGGGSTGGGSTGGGSTGGGSTGGGSAGGGTTTPDPDPDTPDPDPDTPDPDPDTPDPSEDLTQDDIVIEEMEKLLAELKTYKRFSHQTEFSPFYKNVQNVLAGIIADSETTLITPEYVTEHYGDKMKEIREQYYAMCDVCIGEFNSIVSDCATKYKTVLVEYFYDIIPEEAFEAIGSTKE